MNKVYSAMSLGLLLTFAAAWAVGSNPGLLSIMLDPQTLQPNILGYIVMFAPLAMILFSGAVLKRSAAAVRTFFYAFSAVMGISMAWIFVAYTGVSIAQIFLVTSIGFAGLSLWGYTTKRDISGWGSFLIMGLIGLIAAMIINIFLASPAMHFAISAIGVLIFAGLTAYDTQKKSSKPTLTMPTPGTRSGSTNPPPWGRCRSISISSTCSCSCSAFSATATETDRRSPELAFSQELMAADHPDRRHPSLRPKTIIQDIDIPRHW